MAIELTVESLPLTRHIFGNSCFIVARETKISHIYFCLFQSFGIIQKQDQFVVIDCDRKKKDVLSANCYIFLAYQEISVQGKFRLCRRDQRSSSGFIDVHMDLNRIQGDTVLLNRFKVCFLTVMESVLHRAQPVSISDRWYVLHEYNANSATQEYQLRLMQQLINSKHTDQTLETLCCLLQSPQQESYKEYWMLSFISLLDSCDSEIVRCALLWIWRCSESWTLTHWSLADPLCRLLLLTPSVHGRASLRLACQLLIRLHPFLSNHHDLRKGFMLLTLQVIGALETCAKAHLTSNAVYCDRNMSIPQSCKQVLRVYRT